MLKKGIWLSKTEYFARKGLNSSALKEFLNAYKKLKNEDLVSFSHGNYGLIDGLFDEKEKNDVVKRNFMVGDLVHTCCLEKIRFSDAVLNYSGIEKIKNGFIKSRDRLRDLLEKLDVFFEPELIDEELKNFDNYNKKLLYIKKECYDIVDNCVYSYNKIGFDLKEGEIEKCFFSEYKGIALKGKLDFVGYLDGVPVVLDLKTTSSIKSVENGIKKYHYWFQTLFYSYLLDNVVEDLILVFLSKSEREYVIVRFSELPKAVQDAEKKQFEDMMEIYYKYYGWKNNCK